MKKIVIDDLKEFKYLSNLKYSPNGKNIALIVKQANLKNNNYDSYIYVDKGSGFNKLTNSGKDFSYIWLNDEELLFTTARDEHKDINTVFYKININGGEAVKAFDLDLNVNNFELRKDGSYLISAGFNKNCPDYYLLSENKKKAYLKKIEDNKDYHDVDEVPFYFNGAGYINGDRTGLFIYDNKKITRISNKSLNINDYVELNGHIYFSGNLAGKKPNLRDRLYDYNLKTKKTNELLANEVFVGISLVNNNDKDLFLLASKSDKYGVNQGLDIYEYKIDTKKLNKLVEDVSLYNTVGTDCKLGGGYQQRRCKGGFYFISTVNSTANIYLLNKGKVNKYLQVNGAVDLFDVYKNNIVFVGMINNKLQEVYSYKNNKLVQLSHFNEEILKDKYVAKPEKLNIKSCGLDIEGYVLKPIDYSPKKKYKAILDIHGGPKTVYGTVYYHEMQVWVNQGYFVFYCNPKGSDGRGNEFMDIRGEYGVIDYQNIMDFTDAVLAKYNIDPNKVCVTGGSYGGFMTNWIVGHTNRFIAAATQRSISNWISFYGTSDIGPYFANDQTGTKKIQLEKMWNQSPLKYVNNVKTPTLFIHSDEDYRCPLEQGMQFYTSLVLNNVKTKMVIFKGENHELSRGGKPTHRIKRLNEITNWFNSYTK